MTTAKTIDSTISSDEFTYCEEFWDNVGKNICNICECSCLVSIAIFEFFTCISCCPLCFPLGCLEGACSLPISSADQYPAGKWNSKWVQKQHFALRGAEVVYTLTKPSANI